MADAFDSLLQDPVFKAAVDTPAGPTVPPSTEGLAEVAAEVNKPPPGDPSIWNAIPRGANSVRQGANLSWFATQRLAGGAPDPTSVLDSLATGHEFDKLYPKTPEEIDAEKKFFNEGDWSQLLNPRFVAGAALESLPSMVGPIVGSIGGGVAGSAMGPVGTAAGVFAGGGAGSGLVDYGASYKDYLTKKLGPFDRAKWDTAFRSDPNLLDEAHYYAAKHSGMVAAFDMLGMKVGGKIAAPALRAGSSIGTRVGAAAGGIATEGVTETLGEMTGSGLASSGTDWNVQEAVLGGVAAAATGGVQSFIEPGMHALRGTDKSTPATDASIEAAFQAFGGQPAAVAASVPSAIEAAPKAADPSPYAAWAGSEQAPLPAVEPAGPVWRSAVRDAAEKVNLPFGTADQWINTLRNTPGVKQEELDYLGLENALRASGKEKLSKSDVVAEIEANQIEIEDKLLTPLSAYGLGLQQSQARVSEGDALYKKYTLPGGTNYHELLLTLPTSNLTKDRFVSNHYQQEPNILASVRFNSRVDEDGQLALHLEEIQSDWHQAGRQGGYGSSEAQSQKKTLEARFFEERAESDAIYQELKDLGVEEPLSHPRYVQAWNRMMTTSQEISAIKMSVADAPFKTSWPELAFKRMLRYAVDNGFSRITWAPGEEQIRRYDAGVVQGVPMRLDATQENGMRQFYDKILPSVAKKWAKRFGGTYGETVYRIPDPSSDTGTRYVHVPFVDVPPAASTTIRRGLPAFKQSTDYTISASEAVKALTGNELFESKANTFGELVKAIQELSQQFNIDVPVRYHLSYRPNEGYGGLSWNEADGGYVLSVNLAQANDPAEMWSTMVHEFGHMVFFEKFHKASDKVQAAIRAEYEMFRQTLRPTDTMEAMFARRDSALSNMMRQYEAGRQTQLYQLSPEQRKYWASFDEWAAEQVVKWATTQAKPITVVEKFFKGMASYLLRVLQFAKDRMPTVFQNAKPAPTVQSWLNSFITDADALTAPVYSELDARTKRVNEMALAAVGEALEGTSYHSANLPARQAMSLLFGPRQPPQAAAMAAHADRINKFTELMISLPQMAKTNPHIRSLQLYKEDIALWQLEKQNMMNDALTTLKSWRKLRGKKADAVSGLIDDMMNMVYLQPKEAGRKPTQAEFDALVRKNNVTDDGLRVFAQVSKDFDNMLTRYQDLLIREAQRILDPITKFQKLQDIQTSINRMRKTPYFPAMRFGNFTITIRDAANKVIHFETTENARRQRAIVKALRPQLQQGQTLSTGVLPKDATPLLGMPPGLLEMIGDKLSLSPTQKEVLEELRFELAPQQSFRHRFQRKRLVKGYSSQFQRAYANYFFHGSNHFSRIKYADQLRDHVKDVREQAKFMPDGVARGRIANFMSDHLQNVLDPKPDFARLRGMMFVWALGYSPAAATLNLTQMLVGTYPFLASKFGDIKAVRAMGNAGARVSTFYRRGTLATAGSLNAGRHELEMQALSEGVKEGVISEAMAPELAAVSEGRNLAQGFGGNVAERAWSRFSEGAAVMFEMTEQTNRRITFRAAFNLAMDNPNASYIREAVAANSRQYDRLRTAGWTDTAAAAFVVAKDATESTQYQYNQASQPRFMRGKLRTVFVFKSFIQNTMFFLWNYPAAAVRSLLIMGFLGGLMGIPGSEDLKDLLRVVAYNFFGKNFNLEHETRKFVMDVLNGVIDPDILLHGMARKGFGIPQAVDFASGGTVPYPSFDRSKAVSMGQLNPVPLAPIFGPPQRDESRGVAESMQKASGAAFGIGFNLIKAITDSQLNWTDPKRWEKTMPGWIARPTRAYRIYNEERERTRGGQTVLRFDSSDPEHMMEVLGIAMGYGPTRLAKKWDNILAKQEVETYWDLRKQGILKQYFEANEGGDIEDIQRVEGAIAKFNSDLPPAAGAMKIVQKTLDKSIQMREKTKEARESGTALQKSKAGLYQDIDRLFPGTEIDVRKAK